MGFRVYWLQFPILLALFEDHMFANSRIVLAQFKSILGVISILLNEITEITFGAYQLHMRAGIFALLGHRKLSPTDSEPCDEHRNKRNFVKEECEPSGVTP